MPPKAITLSLPIQKLIKLTNHIKTLHMILVMRKITVKGIADFMLHRKKWQKSCRCGRASPF